MPEATVERRSTPRYPMVLAAEVVELPRGTKLAGRTSDISRAGYYIDTLNAIPKGSRVRLRLIHYDEAFQAFGRVVYVSPGLGMGVVFETVNPDEQLKLERWLTSQEEH